jgi:hypothetical protein
MMSRSPKMIIVTSRFEREFLRCEDSACWARCKFLTPVHVRPQRLRQAVNFDETNTDSVVLSSYDRRIIARRKTHRNG